MVSRKRAREEPEVEETPAEPSTMQKLRSMWQFASLMQYIYLFGKIVKIEEDFDIEELEIECLKPYHSEKLSDIGLALLKYVSSHKGLTLEIFDEYTRRQYVAKAPHRNPFGADDEPNKFAEFDVFTKIRVLHQLSTWTLNNPDRLREKMGEKKDTEQTEWRMEPLGWDADERAYFVLDDDRLYCRTDAPLPPEPKRQKAKPKSRKGRATRTSKRRKVSIVDTDDGEEDESMVNGDAKEETTGDMAGEDDGFGGMKWECIAVTLEEYQTFIDSLNRIRDDNTKILRKRLIDQVLPIIEKKAEEQDRKRLRKEKELENLQKMALAKRSSRIAGKMQKQKEEEAVVEEERKRESDLAMARKEQEKQKKMEEDRLSRMMTREQRQKEREMKRILHEEELRRLQEATEKGESNEARLSERHLKAEMRKTQEELEKLQQDENWIFDCSVCGVHGENLDDGSHSIACEKCNVWQHSACHGIPKNEAEKDDFHFICDDCKRKEEEAKKPKLPPLKFKLGSSNSPQNDQTARPTQLDQIANAAPSLSKPTVAPAPVPSVLNGPKLSPVNSFTSPSGSHRPVFYPPSAVPTGGYMFPPTVQNGTIPTKPQAPSVSNSPPGQLPAPYPPASPQKFAPRPSFHPQNNQHLPAPVPAPHKQTPSTSPAAQGTSDHLYQRSPGFPSGAQYSPPRATSSHSNGVSRISQEFRPFETPRNGSTYQAHRPGSSQSTNQDPFRSSFEAKPFPAPSQQLLGTSPQKSASPPHTNGHRLPQPNPMITSPSSSFPPAGNTVSAMSPVKQNSPLQQSTPAPPSAFRTPSGSFSLNHPSPKVASPFGPTSPSSNAPVLPSPMTGISPEKHDGPRPTSSQSFSETPVFPPTTSLSPISKPQIMTPPTKKMTPQKPTPQFTRMDLD